ncbi:PAS domain-containing protein, partial [Streptomyces sp. t39]|uniref:PAS domain-containing protein n=1 Tax=Streptomyces sp. t39 TaxID=1828156 RepID=UPI0021C6E85B
MDEDISGRPGRDEAGTGDLPRLILQQLPVPVAFFDRSARFVTANPAALSAVDRTGDELVGLRPGEVSPGVVISGAEGLEAAIEEVMAAGESRTYETRLRTEGTQERVWMAVLSPITGHDGEVLGCSVVSLDTSEQHRARERLSVLDRASMRIGSRLDVITTADELAEMATETFADFVAVDLLAPVLAGDEPRAPAPGGTIVFHRAAQHSVLDGCPESVVPVGTSHTFDRESAVGRVLGRGEAARYPVDEESLRLWDITDPERARSIREHRIHSTMVAPLTARG